MKKVITLILSLFILTLLIVWTYNSLYSKPIEQNSNVNVEQIKNSDWLTYRNEEYGFEFRYPEDWEFNESKSSRLFSEIGPIGDMYSFRSPDKNQNDLPFSLRAYVIPGVHDYNTMDYFNYAHEGDRVSYNVYELVNINNNEFYKIVSIPSESFIAYIMIHNNIYYEISYFNTRIDDLNEDTEKIINTFRFID